MTVNLYIGSSFKAFSPLNHLLTNSLVRASNKNINRYLGDYIIFKGFNSFSKPNFKNYFVDFDFISIYIRTLETKKEIKEKEEIFIVRKKFLLVVIIKFIIKAQFHQLNFLNLVKLIL